MKYITSIIAACCLVMTACAQSPKGTESQNNPQTNPKEMTETFFNLY